MRVEDLLNCGTRQRAVRLLHRRGDGPLLIGAERRTKKIRRFNQALNLRRERLPLETLDDGERRGRERRGAAKQNQREGGDGRIRRRQNFHSFSLLLHHRFTKTRPHAKP